MKLISHRGNLNGPLPDKENSREYINKAIQAGFDVEIDIWEKEGQFFLGHDGPTRRVVNEWLRVQKDFLWIHAKNFGAIELLLKENYKFFFHEKERHTIIQNANLIWSHELSEASKNSVIPLLSREEYEKKNQYGYVFAICSDYVGYR